MSTALTSLFLHAVALASGAPEEALSATPVVVPGDAASVPPERDAATTPDPTATRASDRKLDATPARVLAPLAARALHRHPIMFGAAAPNWSLPQAVLFGAQAAAPAAEAAAPAEAPAPTPDAAVATTPPGAPEATVEDHSIEGRRRPGYVTELPPPVVQNNPGAVAVPPPEAFPTDEFPIPDRWRLAKALCPDKNFVGMQNVCHSEFDPYHQNTLKGDRPLDPKKVPFFMPIKGDDWFLGLEAISDTVVEPSSFPTPVATQVSTRPGEIDQFGRDRSLNAAQTFIVGAALTKGSTAYKPPDIEYHITLAYQVNYAQVQERGVLKVITTPHPHRTDNFLGVQELFVDKHLGNRSSRYDFDSIRIGIQPFQSDFRGFLFNDNNLGVRLFGNRDDNRYQYNVEAIWRIDKDTNSGLNDLTRPLRKDYIFTANLFVQDFPLPGITSLVSATANLNREKKLERDKNGFPIIPAFLGNVRPREYEVYYLGYSLDGHIHRINISSSFYGAFGRDRNSFFTGRPAKIRSYFGAAELSYDIDWIRVKLSGLYASGDKHPKDNTENGFDSILENPIFAGADTSYFVRRGIPFAGGGINVLFKQPNGLLNDLRSSKTEGQSNFNNPGTMLLGLGGDFDLLPQLRFSTNINHVWFQNTSSLRELRNEGSVPKSIGWDYSGSLIWRPKMIQNTIFRLSAAVLDPGKGFTDLFTNANHDGRYYSVLFDATLAF